MNKFFIIMVFVSTLVYDANSQSWQVKSANRSLASKLYLEAIPRYENLIRRDSSNYEVLSSLAECYRLTNNTDGQILCYKKLLEAEQISDIEKLNFGQALMASDRNEEAKNIFAKIKNDKRASLFIRDISNPNKFSRNIDAYAVAEVSFNSNDNDLSAIPFLENKVVFSSNREISSSWVAKKHGWTGKNYCHLFITEKGVSGQYEIPAPFLPDYAPKFNDGPFCSNKKGNSIFFTRNSTNKKDKSKDGSQKLKIMNAIIENDNFQNLVVLSFNNNDYNYAHPAISADEKRLYFSSDMPGGQGGMDLWYSTIDSNGSWGTPINLGEKVNTKGNELFPSITVGDILYFSSNGLGGLGGLDIYETKLIDNVPSKVYNMGKPVNSAFDDFSYNLDESRTKGFLTSNRKTGGMDDNIYSVNVLKTVLRGTNLNMNVIDKEKQGVMPFAKIKLNADTFTTDEKGQFQKILEDNVNYNLSVSKEKYFDFKDTFMINPNLDEDEITKRIELEENNHITLLAAIYDAITGVGIEDVKITLRDSIRKVDFQLIHTDKSGEYKMPIKGNKIGDTLLYVVTIEKESYLSKTIIFSHVITKIGEIQLNELLDLSIGKVEVGMDLAKMIDLKPIYFDKGKSIIRADAAKELDKIVEIMKKNISMNIELGAHTDSRGSASTNLKLSSSRAKSATAYIIKNGISKMRIVAKGYGETKILNTCLNEGKVKTDCTEEQHSVNRRIEFIITK